MIWRCSRTIGVPPVENHGSEPSRPGQETYLREPRLALLGRLVETPPTAGSRRRCRSRSRRRRRRPAAELFALVRGRRAQAPSSAALAAAVGTVQRVHVQIGVVDAAVAGSGAVCRRRPDGNRLEHGVVGRCQIALRVKRLRLAADIRVGTVDAAHFVARTPLAAVAVAGIAARLGAAVRFRFERLHFDAKRRSRQVAGRVWRQVFRVQVLLHLLCRVHDLANAS